MRKHTTVRSGEVAVRVLIDERRRFLNFVRSLVGDKDDAEEIVQRASLKVLTRSAAVRDPARAKAWIYRILRNEITDHYRRLAVRSKRGVELHEDLVATVSTSAFQPKLCACAVEELARLRPNYSDALRATQMNGEAIVAYAARKSLSANSATVLVHRARRSLRSRVEAHCGECAGSGCFNCTCPARPPVAT